MSDVTLKIEPTQPGVLTILEGEALEQKHPEKIKLSGNIESVKNFLDKRYKDQKGKSLQEVDKEKAVVIVDETNMSIQLLLDPENFFGLEVLAKLELTNEIKQFHINDNKEFNREAMIKLLKYNKRFFADPLKYEALLESYMKLNLSGNTQIKSESDDRGNKDVQFKKQISSQNIPQNFTLEMPIFKGQKVIKFQVEICIDVKEMSVSFWFESVELVELIEMYKKEIFDEQLKSCQDFVIIHK